MYLPEEGVRGAFLPVDERPLVDPAAERLILPESECFLVYHRRLDYLSIHENAPCDCIHVFVVKVITLSSLSCGIDCLVTDGIVLVQDLN